MKRKQGRKTEKQINPFFASRETGSTNSLPFFLRQSQYYVNVLCEVNGSGSLFSLPETEDYKRMETAILTANGIEVYQSEIDIVCKEYIDSLYNPEMISKSSVFSGMLFEISKRIIKPFLEADKRNRNSKQHNFELLNAVFYNIYIFYLYFFRTIK